MQDLQGTTDAGPAGFQHIWQRYGIGQAACFSMAGKKSLKPRAEFADAAETAHLSSRRSRPSSMNNQFSIRQHYCIEDSRRLNSWDHIIDAAVDPTPATTSVQSSKNAKDTQNQFLQLLVAH
jgi:hypothetical protein